MPPPRRVSFRQMEILADFAETHQHITMGRFGSLQGLQEARQAWESVAVRLNRVGIKKTSAQWRRYWIEYKAKLRSKAADSRRGTLGVNSMLRPLSEREQQLLEVINRVAAEGLPDSNASEIQYSPIPQSPSPESQQPLLEVEWLDYESESDEQLAGDTDRSHSVEPEGDSGSVDMLQSAEKEDEVARDYNVGERWKKRGSFTRHAEEGTSRKEFQRTDSQSDRLRRSHRKELYQDRHTEFIDSNRFSETPLQNNIINTSSIPSKTASLSDVTATALEYFHSKKNKSKETKDPDLLFFHSILPEMRQMTPDQKRQFKSGVWSLANQILDQNTLDLPSDHNYGLSQRS